MRWFHGDSDEVSGAPRILVDLREDGETISPQDGRKAMRKLGLRGICPRAVGSDNPRDRARDTYPPDATKRQWDTGVLNAVWVGDISYLRTWEGWLYLATVIDAHSRRVIGWAIADHMRTDLVEDALKMAITLRGERPSRSCSTPTEEPNTPRTRSPSSRPRTASPGRWAGPVICWDNAMAESFFATLKTEFYYRRVVAHQGRRRRGRRGLDRGQVQPPTPALLNRSDQPRRVRMQHCIQPAAERQAA